MVVRGPFKITKEEDETDFIQSNDYSVERVSHTNSIFLSPKPKTVNDVL